MNMKRTVLAVVTAAAMTLAARANSISYVLTDINTSSDYTVANTGQTFSGNGFVGLYGSDVSPTEQFAHLFGLELVNFSRTAIQVDVAALAGVAITSAYLTFDILDGNGSPQSVTVSSYLGDGALGYDWAPTAEASGVYSVGGGANSLDVTALISSIISAGNPWLGLHLMGSTNYMWTYTDNGYGYDVDRANVRLTVNYGAAGVPDHGATFGLLAIALGSLALVRRRIR